MTNFQSWATSLQQHMESTIDHAMPACTIAPQRLHEAMRYAILGGGKRVRALLAYAAGEFCNANLDTIETAAIAVELIHAYSLVHDDMPCMDDDDLRRGKASCHKQYDDATALLVGDALQTLAFQLLAKPGLHTDSHRQIQMIQLLAVASGSRGMAGGQAIDLASVGLSLTQEELEFMHIHKTGALIRAAAMLGALAGNEYNEEKVHSVDLYSQSIGLAFQVVDDVLDAEADTATLGKTAGKDADANKPTYVTILGLSRAKELANELYNNAVAPLTRYGQESQRLIELAQFITQRHY